MMLQDSQQLHGIPFKGRLSIREDKTGQYEPSNEIKDIKNINEVVGAPSQQAPQQGFVPPQQGFTPPTGPANPGPTGFTPPQQQQGFTPPQQGFAPPQQQAQQQFAPPTQAPPTQQSFVPPPQQQQQPVQTSGFTPPWAKK
jgi:hypothetical protein